MSDLSNPLTRIESYLAGIAGVLEAVPEPPLTRIEEYLKACYDSISGVAQTAAENLAAEYDPAGSYAAGDYVTYEGFFTKPWPILWTLRGSGLLRTGKQRRLFQKLQIYLSGKPFQMKI